LFSGREWWKNYFIAATRSNRLRMIGLGRFWSIAIPLVIFSLGHWSGGAANILIAFAAALILTAFYLWRRDLAANMIGHGLVDFVANVLPALFS
jgi:CAAX protease family protein